MRRHVRGMLVTATGVLILSPGSILIRLASLATGSIFAALFSALFLGDHIAPRTSAP